MGTRPKIGELHGSPSPVLVTSEGTHHLAVQGNPGGALKVEAFRAFVGKVVTFVGAKDDFFLFVKDPKTHITVIEPR